MRSVNMWSHGTMAGVPPIGASRRMTGDGSPAATNVVCSLDPIRDSVPCSRSVSTPPTALVKRGHCGKRLEPTPINLVKQNQASGSHVCGELPEHGCGLLLKLQDIPAKHRIKRLVEHHRSGVA